MSKVIEVIVSPTGETKIETKGFSGAECRDASRFVEVSLGAAVSESLTREYHQAPSVQTENQQRS